jgi:hypothetical protein
METEEASVLDVFGLLETRPVLTILFVDDSDLCKNYLSLPWVKEEAEILMVDEGIVDTFQVGKVPQYRFFLAGNEIANLVGTCHREMVLDMKQKVFSNVRPLKKESL